jgi:hypothetical protein
MRFPLEFDLHALETFVLAVELGGMSQRANFPAVPWLDPCT